MNLAQSGVTYWMEVGLVTRDDANQISTKEHGGKSKLGSRFALLLHLSSWTTIDDPLACLSFEKCLEIIGGEGQLEMTLAGRDTRSPC